MADLRGCGDLGAIRNRSRREQQEFNKVCHCLVFLTALSFQRFAWRAESLSLAAQHTFFRLAWYKTRPFCCFGSEGGMGDRGHTHKF